MISILGINSRQNVLSENDSLPAGRYSELGVSIPVQNSGIPTSPGLTYVISVSAPEPIGSVQADLFLKNEQTWVNPFNCKVYISSAFTNYKVFSFVLKNCGDGEYDFPSGEYLINIYTYESGTQNIINTYTTKFTMNSARSLSSRNIKSSNQKFYDLVRKNL